MPDTFSRPANSESFSLSHLHVELCHITSGGMHYTVESFYLCEFHILTGFPLLLPVKLVFAGNHFLFHVIV